MYGVYSTNGQYAAVAGILERGGVVCAVLLYNVKILLYSAENGRTYYDKLSYS